MTRISRPRRAGPGQRKVAFATTQVGNQAFSFYRRSGMFIVQLDADLGLIAALLHSTSRMRTSAEAVRPVYYATLKVEGASIVEPDAILVVDPGRGLVPILYSTEAVAEPDVATAGGSVPEYRA